MIAIPLSREDSTVISDLYGNAPYFALLDLSSGYFKVSENKGCGDGMNTAAFVSDKNIDSTIFYYMGEKVYDYLEDKGLKVYSCLKNHCSIDEIYMLLLANKAKVVTKENSSTLLDSGNGGCTCKAK